MKHSKKAKKKTIKKVRIPKSWKLAGNFKIGLIRFRIARRAELEKEGLPHDRIDGLYFVKEPAAGPITSGDRTFYFVPLNANSGGAFVGAVMSESDDFYAHW